MVAPQTAQAGGVKRRRRESHWARSSGVWNWTRSPALPSSRYMTSTRSVLDAGCERAGCPALRAASSARVRTANSLANGTQRTGSLTRNCAMRTEGRCRSSTRDGMSKNSILESHSRNAPSRLPECTLTDAKLTAGWTMRGAGPVVFAWHHLDPDLAHRPRSSSAVVRARRCLRATADRARSRRATHPVRSPSTPFAAARREPTPRGRRQRSPCPHLRQWSRVSASTAAPDPGSGRTVFCTSTATRVALAIHIAFHRAAY